MYAFVCVVVVVSLSPVADGETEEENVEEYANQYCDPEPEGQYLDQDFLEGFENGKFIPPFDAYFVLVFINTTY